MRVTKKKSLLLGTSIFALILIFNFHENRRPFLLTKDYSVSASLSGSPIAATVFKPMFLDDVYFIRLEKSAKTEYPWIVFCPKRQFAADPIGVYHSFFGYSYTHADQALGVELNDAKLEDNWRVDMDGLGGVMKMGNSDLKIQIISKTANTESDK